MSFHILVPWLFVFSIIVCCLSRLSATATVLGLPLPPGPKASWFRTLSLPTTYPWITYANWQNIYGDVIYLRVLGNPVIVLNSSVAISDLLERRGNIYSSRPIRTMVVELIGWDWLFSSMCYGDRWKQHRNLFHKHFRPNDSDRYRALQQKETHTLLRNLLQTPENFRYHIRRSAAAVVLNLSYGHQIAQDGDDYVQLADKAIAGLAQAGIFGTYLVDYLPFLKYVPAWFPFASFKREAFAWRKLTRELVDRPFDMIKQKLVEGTEFPCLVTQELESRTAGLDSEDEEVVKNVAATAYAAGSDTVVSAILSFFLAMTIHPEIQKRAQDELCSVIGTRLPALSDRNDLPFIECICYELLRWNPVTPLGLAHCVMQDDEYRGYQIPKGTTVIPNVWAIFHDPETYPDPMRFNPDRFMNFSANEEKINEKPDAAFGFGRRICPGRHVALDFIFIVVASVLTVYDICRAKDENGNDINPDVEYTSLLLSHPKPFKCDIRPRSEDAITVVTQM
ncbi:cytochrome P450 [Crucibulum laeve]|uniref:Cytochrome P450 n=1 Tax=Crucibulum laeve TaxID=68775 RepID=A0A5C3M6T0_9AGAR|nr:cytochrome P450 [Crucibulum laeve]